MEYQVTLDSFTGPLDLLLHLIREHDLDLLNLDVGVIADQYLAYIETMDPSQLEAMSEYLVMAAWLIEMKSRMLLPKEEIDEEDDYEQKRRRMIQRLIEKNQINQVLNELNASYETRHQEYSKLPTLAAFDENVQEKVPDDLEVYDLVAAMQKVLQRKVMMQPLESKVAKVEISVDERSGQIEDFFARHKGETIDFALLFDEGDTYFAIVTFLSVLVLVKNHKLEIDQKSNFDTIYLKGRES